MLYFDACYILKCYLNEPGAEKVRRLAREAGALASCVHGRAEFWSGIARHEREGRLSRRTARDILRQLREDESNDVWHWLPLDRQLVELTCTLLEQHGRALPLRTGDALHLACAREHGFPAIHSSDRVILGAAKAFGLTGVNVLE